MYRIEEYIPDALYEYYDLARETLVTVLKSAGIVKRTATHDGPRKNKSSL